MFVFLKTFNHLSINFFTMQARIIIEVVAGVIPGTPMPEYTKQFAVPSAIWYRQGDWQGKDAEAEKEIAAIHSQAAAYMQRLWAPQQFNWVRCDWLYL
jgi:hypothetical protein